MNTTDWQIILYPLGFLSSIAFGARFIVQWIQSERNGKSVVPPLFWHLSLFGNITLLIHAFIQVQYHICFVQTCNTVISWRNLNLLQQKKRPYSLQTVLIILCLSLLLMSGLFAIQDYYFLKESSWFRIPVTPWQSNAALSIPFIWHLIGFLGFSLFSSRFWIQWWSAEKTGQSVLSPSFWWISLVGALLSLIYSARIFDPVNAIGPLIGIVPYIRNLMLMKKHFAARPTL